MRKSNPALIAVLFVFLVGSQVFGQVLTPEHFSKARWGRNPLTHSAPRKEDAQFVIETASNSRFSPFIQIMPNEFRLVSGYESPEIRKLVDQSLQKILMTPTGKKLCQKSTHGSWKRIHYYFGVSEDTAKKIAEHCSSDDSSELILKYSYVHEWIFVETTDTHFPIHGWTTPKNVSFLFFAENDFTEVNFYRTLIHELATALDSKESWGYLGNLNLAPKISRASYAGNQQCEVIAAIKRPMIKYATAALRAEVFEDQILSEMGLIASKPVNSESCAHKILRKIPAVLAIGDIVSADSAVGQFDIRMCGMDPIIRRSLFENLELLESEKVTDLELSKEMSVCEFLTTPRVDSYFVGPYTGGPRPKVEPWEQQGEYNKLSQSLTQAYQERGSPSQNGKLNPEALNQLNRIESSRSEIGNIPDRQRQIRDLLTPR